MASSIFLLAALSVFGEEPPKVERSAAGVGSRPLMQLRLSRDQADTPEVWQENLRAIAAHPGCCDEVWFSTIHGIPDLSRHAKLAAQYVRAAADLRKLGIVPSLQIQTTLGHSDKGQSDAPELTVAKTWTGWTDYKGTETRYCNCPRQQAFLDYVAAFSRLYARVGFRSVWIDDDLRYRNHRPAVNASVYVGCWCATCLKDFSTQTGRDWSREELAAAVGNDPSVAARWRTFSISSLCLVAKSVAQMFHEVSPDTVLAQQQNSIPDAVDSVRALLKTLHETSERPVGYRAGAVSYYDTDPNQQLSKSVALGVFRRLLGNPVHVAEWTCEIESWPHCSNSRTGQSVLVEGFAALMYGQNEVSYWIGDGRNETVDFYARRFYAPLAQAAPTLHAFAAVLDRARPIGFLPDEDLPQDNANLLALNLRRTGVPLLAGPGICRGRYSAQEAAVDFERMPSRDVQALRDDFDRRGGGLPARLTTPFNGHMLPYVDTSERLAAVALVNPCIDEQSEVTLALRDLPEGVVRAVWHELRHADREVAVRRTDEGAFVTVPAIAAWNAGYLDLH